jgi:hypothetical protein
LMFHVQTQLRRHSKGCARRLQLTNTRVRTDRDPQTKWF